MKPINVPYALILEFSAYFSSIVFLSLGSSDFNADITSREIDEPCDGCSPDELQKARKSREALAQLWKMVESRISQR